MPSDCHCRNLGGVNVIIDGDGDDNCASLDEVHVRNSGGMLLFVLFVLFLLLWLLLLLLVLTFTVRNSGGILL